MQIVSCLKLNGGNTFDGSHSSYIWIVALYFGGWKGNETYNFLVVCLWPWTICVSVVCNGNRTEWTPIRSAIIRVITKVDECAGGVDFFIASTDIVFYCGTL